jgi:hypothetical protein
MENKVDTGALVEDTVVLPAFNDVEVIKEMGGEVDFGLSATSTQ